MNTTIKHAFSIGLLVLAMTTSGCAGCGPGYSNGERECSVRKIGNKGLIWKSWEGECLLSNALISHSDGNGGTSMRADTFVFSVDPSAVEKVQAAARSGQRVTLFYKQWFISPSNIDSSYVVVDVKGIQ